MREKLSTKKASTVRVAWWLYCAGVAALITFLLSQLLQALEKRTSLQQLPDYGDLVQFDPEREGGHLLPNLNMNVRGEFAAVRFLTNSKGFRSDREFAYTPSPDVYRILLLGDSYVDGMRTDQEHIIGFILQETLNTHLSKPRRVEVLIAGHNNPANAWYYYQEHGRKYHPELVILGLTIGNDFTSHNYCYGGLFPEAGEDGQVVLRKATSHIYPASFGILMPLPEAAYQPIRRWEWLEDNEFYLRRWLAERSRLFGYALPPALLPPGNRRRHISATENFLSLGLFYQPSLPEIQGMYQEMEEMLTGMHKTVATEGATFLVALFPVRTRLLCFAQMGGAVTWLEPPAVWQRSRQRLLRRTARVARARERTRSVFRSAPGLVADTPPQWFGLGVRALSSFSVTLRDTANARTNMPRRPDPSVS